MTSESHKVLFISCILIFFEKYTKTGMKTGMISNKDDSELSRKIQSSPTGNRAYILLSHLGTYSKIAARRPREYRE